MIISLRLFGALSKRFGGAKADVELPEGAVLRDLLDAIDSRWGATLAPDFWEGGAKRFKGSVMLMSEGMDLTDESSALVDEQEVMVLMPVSGG
ncbi:MAG TPA: MoaD/ThiS family protein [Anaerolineales bacterium]|nr:MoaD/ThiS family protein [Anaerolineales bacterium]